MCLMEPFDVRNNYLQQSIENNHWENTIIFCTKNT